MNQAPLHQLSLVAANFGGGRAFADVLEDWFRFLGGKPAEVCIVDGGSDGETQSNYWQLFQAGKIDKLQMIRRDHAENHKDLCFVQEHTAGAIASRDYILWFKADTLPFREGHEKWLAEAYEYLDRPDTFAVGGSFNIPSKHHDAWPGWYFSDKCSENFALMKRQSFVDAMQEFAGEYIASGFRGVSPADQTRQARYLIEVAFEQYIARHQKYTLVKVEDPTWTVFHTNVAGKEMPRVRENYFARRDVNRYMNARIYNPVWGGCYYGKSPERWVRLKWAMSESIFGTAARGVKRLIGLRPANSR